MQRDLYDRFDFRLSGRLRHPVLVVRQCQCRKACRSVTDCATILSDNAIKVVLLGHMSDP